MLYHIEVLKLSSSRLYLNKREICRAFFVEQQDIRFVVRFKIGEFLIYQNGDYIKMKYNKSI